MRCEHGFSGGSPLKCGSRQDCAPSLSLFFAVVPVDQPRLSPLHFSLSSSVKVFSTCAVTLLP